MEGEDDWLRAMACVACAVLVALRSFWCEHRVVALNESLGPCCGGKHFWGHGNGCNDGRGGKYWKCNYGCRRPLKYLAPDEQEKRRARCVHCLALPLEAEGMSKADAGEMAETLLKVAAMDSDWLGLHVQWTERASNERLAQKVYLSLRRCTTLVMRFG